MSDNIKYKALKEANDKWDFAYCKAPLCPHCKAEQDIEKLDGWGLYVPGVHELVCTKCAQKFTVSTHCEYKFSTDEQEDYDDE